MGPERHTDNTHNHEWQAWPAEVTPSISPSDGNRAAKMAPTLPSLEQPSPDRQVEVLSLRSRHEETSVSCGLCDGPTEKIYVSQDCWSKRLIVRTEHLPAYRCNECRVQTVDNIACIEFLSEAINRISRTRDRIVVRRLRQELRLLQQHQELAQASGSR